MALLIFVTLLVYLKMNRKYAGKRYFSIVFIAILFAITLVIRLVCAGLVAASTADENTNVVTGFIESVKTIYATAGGLTFEGQEIGENKESILLSIASLAYYATILWLAVTFIFVVTVGLSYEINSKLQLSHEKNQANNIYIFTAVSEDTLVLANSIEKWHEKDSKKPLIIFAGNELEPFDKDNELHRKIMARGYIYQSYYKEKDKNLEKPLLVRLGLANKKSPFEVLLNKKIKVFALENDAREYGLESKNSDVVFDDIDQMIRMEFFDDTNEEKISEEKIINFIQKNIDYNYKNGSKKFNLQYIDYYLLSNSTINYEFYDEAILNRIRNVVDNNLLNKQVSIIDNKVFLEDKKKPNPTLYLYIKSIFQIHVINESYLAGEDLIKKRREIQIEDIKEDVRQAKEREDYRYKRFAINRVKVLHESGKPLEEDNQEERTYNALILGFGQTGQMALNNLYVDTVSLEPSKPEKGINLDRYIPSRFIARVFDLNISQSIGVFAQTHPSYLIKKLDDINNDKVPFFNLDQLKEFYGNDYPDNWDEIDELMKFPYIYASDKNCKDLEFLKSIDMGTGNIKDNEDETSKEAKKNKKQVETIGKQLGRNNAIVICLGNDEENIKVANAVLQNIRQELYNSDYSNTKYFYQTIYVNIRDEKNVGRLNWNDDIEFVRHKGIRVRAFGNREEMYSYESIIDDEKYIKANNTYNAVGSLIWQEEKRIADEKGVEKYTMPGKDRNALVLDPSSRETLIKLIEDSNKDMDKSRIAYLRISDYKKASSKNSALFSAYTSTYINEMGIEELDNYEDKKLWKYLSFLEHQRWCRYNISCGYIYSKTFVENMSAHEKEDDYLVYSKYGHNATEYSKSHLKLHVCLLPNSYEGMNYLDDSTECYDYGNVLCASLVAARQEKKSKSSF